ncbi:hypothetical protein ACFLSQ_06985 [Bacteroidota bacterium]
MEFVDLLKTVKALTDVLPPLSDLASSNLSQLKPLWVKEENPLDIMTIYDKKPELIDDVSDLLSKIIAADNGGDPG